MDTFAITNGTRGTLPRVPFLVMKEKILGKRYSLSLVFIGTSRMRRLNATYRKKDMPTDILSFPLSKTEGEMFINRNVADTKAKDFGLSTMHYFSYIFIHGCLHLKGMEHGRTMEKEEDSWCRVFTIPTSTR